MKEDFNKLELIENYLSGKLKGSELTKFENFIKNDKELADVVKNFEISIITVNQYGRSSLKDKLKRIHGKLVLHTNQSTETPKSVSKKVIELLDNIYNQYFRPYDDVITARSKRKGILDNGMAEYSRGNYGAAIKLYKSILKDKPKDVYALFYCGISLLETGKTNEAINKFNKLLKIEDNIFKDQAEWYLGLSHLKNNNVKEAMEIFDEINKDNSEYRRARNIIKKLKDVS